jgi:hypothetical protein
VFSRGGDTRYGQLIYWAVIREKPNALDVVRRVVQRGAPINEVKYEKEPMVYWERELFGLVTPLHRAAESGNTDVVRYLLEQGADPLKLESVSDFSETLPPRSRWRNPKRASNDFRDISSEGAFEDLVVAAMTVGQCA